MKALAIAACIAGCVPQPSAATVYTTGATGGGWTSSSEKGPRGDHDLLTAGLVTLGAGYVGSVVGTQISLNVILNDVDRSYSTVIGSDMWIPVIGPLLALSDNEGQVYDSCKLIHTNCDDTHVFTVAIAVGAAAQVTGAVLAVIGFTRSRHGGNAGSTGFAIVPQSNGFAVAGRF